MRLIVVGCENVGKTTLANNIHSWGQENGFPFHLDDHFTIPDTQNLNEDEQERMVNLGPVVKERFQRFQIHYHIQVLQHHDHVFITGCHIEEAVYGPRYYYDGAMPGGYGRKIETEFPSDTILVLLTASAEVIAQRMKANPHKYTLVKEDEIQEVSEEFLHEFGQSWIRPKIRIDTTEHSPQEVMEELLSLVKPHLAEKDLLRLASL